MTPAHRHMHFDESFKAGMLPIMTVGEPGTQGATVLGTHGMGVNTPSAAEVAEASRTRERNTVTSQVRAAARSRASRRGAKASAEPSCPS